MALLNPIVKYTDKETRRKIANVQLLPLYKYGIELFSGEKEKTKRKLEVSMMTVSKKFVKRSICLKVSNLKINKSLKWNMPIEEMNKRTAIFMHNMMTHNQPKDLFQLIKPSISQRIRTINPRKIPKTKKFQRTFMNSSIAIYDKLPQKMKELNPKKFEKRLKEKFM